MNRDKLVDIINPLRSTDIQDVEDIADQILAAIAEEQKPVEDSKPTAPAALHFSVDRDKHGFVCGIIRDDGYVVLHLQDGTVRDEEEVEGIVGLLNKEQKSVADDGLRNTLKVYAGALLLLPQLEHIGESLNEILSRHKGGKV